MCTLELRKCSNEHAMAALQKCDDKLDVWRATNTKTDPHAVKWTAKMALFRAWTAETMDLMLYDFSSAFEVQWQTCQGICIFMGSPVRSRVCIETAVIKDPSLGRAMYFNTFIGEDFRYIRAFPIYMFGSGDVAQRLKGQPRWAEQRTECFVKEIVTYCSKG